MEVHHHAHDPPAPHHKKNWKNYFWEFLMLFLAVFCGFLAEYQLEHKIEKDREIQYIQSLVNDLKTDTSKLNHNIKSFKGAHLMQDSALAILPSLENGFSESFNKNFQAFAGFPDFIYTDATIQQLKNSGGFRLIRNQKVVDSIMSYDAVVKRALINEVFLGGQLVKTIELSNQIFNQNLLSQKLKQGITPKQLEAERFEYLLIKDKTTLSQFANHLSYHNYMSGLVAGNMKELETKAEGLINFLYEEYDIE